MQKPSTDHPAAPALTYSIVFATLETKPPLPLITPEISRQLPEKAHAHIRRLGTSWKRGDDLINVDVPRDKNDQYAVLERVVKWVRQMEHEPGADVLPSRLHVVTKARNAKISFHPQEHVDSSKYQSSEETHELFKTEMGVYLFARETGMVQLAQEARSRLSIWFPMFVGEIKVVFKLLGRDGLTDLVTCDPDFASHVSAAIGRCEKELLADKDMRDILASVCPRESIRRWVDSTATLDLTKLVTSIYDKHGGMEELLSAVARVLNGTSLSQVHDGPGSRRSVSVPKPHERNSQIDVAIIQALEEGRVYAATETTQCELLQASEHHASSASQSHNSFRITARDILVAPGSSQIDNRSKTLVLRNRSGAIGRVPQASVRPWTMTASREELPHKRHRQSYSVPSASAPTNMSPPTAPSGVRRASDVDPRR